MYHKPVAKRAASPETTSVTLVAPDGSLITVSLASDGALPLKEQAEGVLLEMAAKLEARKKIKRVPQPQSTFAAWAYRAEV